MLPLVYLAILYGLLRLVPSPSDYIIFTASLISSLKYIILIPDVRPIKERNDICYNFTNSMVQGSLPFAAIKSAVQNKNLNTLVRYYDNRGSYRGSYPRARGTYRGRGYRGRGYRGQRGSFGRGRRGSRGTYGRGRGRRGNNNNTSNNNNNSNMDNNQQHKCNFCGMVFIGSQHICQS